MDKLIFTECKEPDCVSRVMRVSPIFHSLVNTLSVTTGLSYPKITEQFADFLQDKIEIKGRK